MFVIMLGKNSFVSGTVRFNGAELFVEYVYERQLTGKCLRACDVNSEDLMVKESKGSERLRIALMQSMAS
jgi:hypothetical protein